MKNKQKLYSIALASTALVFVLSILISSVASAAQVTRIGSGSDPAIYGSKVVWTNGGVIHIYDLTAKTDTTVSSSAASYPAIYGNKLVWHDESSGVLRLTVYDIPSGTRSYITKDIDSGSIPAIYGNRIVWSANYNETNYNYNVYMRDISTSTQTRITYGEHPDIYDTKITYFYDDGEGRRIAVYDIASKEIIKIPYSGDLVSPHMYGNKVIWSDFYTRMGYIAMYDIVTKKVTTVTNDNVYTGDPNNPDAGDDTGTHTNIYGDKIVYAKSGTDQFGSAGVYAYSISTGQSTQVANYENGVLTTPDVYGSTIVWGIEGNYGAGAANDNSIYISDLSATNTLPPVAAFTANVTSGPAPSVILFTDTSIGGVPTSWYWDTGDGIYSKHAMNATHTFTKPGVYNVTLTVANEAGSSTVTKPNYITVTSPQAPVADFFSPQVDKARSNLDSVKNETLSFIDNSTGSPISWLWDFGDGTISTAQNPTHVYTNEGGYTVTLTVKNAIGSNSVSKYCYALVRMDDGGIIAPAYFSSNVTSGIAPLTVLFHDTTIPDVNGDYAYGREWDFGDRTNYGDDYDENNSTYITHTYKKPGKYTVKLRSYDIGGGCIITKYNYITVIDPKVPVADFSSNVTSGAAPLVVLLTDTSTGEAPTSWYWDFGDGINSKHAMNVTHTFTKPGNYTIGLTVENDAGNNTATKLEYIVVTDPNAPVADFNSNVTEGYAPLTVQFYDISQKATSRIWDFNGDGQPDLSDINPVYVYANPGTYTVKLTVSNENGTASKTAAINVLTPSSSNGGSSHSSSSGGGAGGSPEPQSNVPGKGNFTGCCYKRKA